MQSGRYKSKLGLFLSLFLFLVDPGKEKKRGQWKGLVRTLVPPCLLPKLLLVDLGGLDTEEERPPARGYPSFFFFFFFQGCMQDSRTSENKEVTLPTQVRSTRRKVCKLSKWTGRLSLFFSFSSVQDLLCIPYAYRHTSFLPFLSLLLFPSFFFFISLSFFQFCTCM